MFSDSCANLLFGGIFLLIVCEDSKLVIYEVTSAVDIMLVLA